MFNGTVFSVYNMLKIFMVYLVEEINFTKLIKQSIICCTDTSWYSME